MPLCCFYPHPGISEMPAHYMEYECRICRPGYVVISFTLSPDMMTPMTSTPQEHMKF